MFTRKPLLQPEKFAVDGGFAALGVAELQERAKNDPPVAVESKIIACGKLLRQGRRSNEAAVSLL
jgi:hypothetical protein